MQQTQNLGTVNFAVDFIFVGDFIFQQGQFYTTELQRQFSLYFEVDKFFVSDLSTIRKPSSALCPLLKRLLSVLCTDFCH